MIISKYGWDWMLLSHLQRMDNKEQEWPLGTISPTPICYSLTKAIPPD
jgi:hypothetical protein